MIKEAGKFIILACSFDNIFGGRENCGDDMIVVAIGSRGGGAECDSL